MEKQTINGIDDVHVSDEVVTERKRGVRIRSGTCMECGDEVAQLGSGRTMRYCSDACRMRAYRRRKGNMVAKDNVTENVTNNEPYLICELQVKIVELEGEIKRLMKQDNEMEHDMRAMEDSCDQLNRSINILNVTIQALQKEVSEKNVTIQALRKEGLDKTVTRYEKDVVELHCQSGGQCQASTKKGDRCRSRTPGSLRILTLDHKNQAIAISLCPTHYQKVERNECVVPHSSVI